MNKLLLIILDGWGHDEAKKCNAVALSELPNFNHLWKNCPHTLIQASGKPVGLPPGQMGSSEVGHSIIGAGRNVPQLSTLITNSILDESFFKNSALKNAMDHVKKNKSRLHIMGLTSDGGVHSFWAHLNALLQMAKRENLAADQVIFHVILDGRDVGPKTGKEYVGRLLKEMREIGVGKIATVTGRYWTMDRDKRWDRVQKGYEAAVAGVGHKARNPESAIGDNYYAGKTDEFIEPTVIVDSAGPVGAMQDGDSVIFFNFRPDRARQIVRALSDPHFKDFERKVFPKLLVTCMAPYDSTLRIPVAFTMDDKERAPILSEIIDGLGIAQLRIAETEKYAHVTYFFNSGRENPLPKEERVLIPSPKVATYDLAPEMSAPLITDRLLEKMPGFPFAVCNFANADMVGHSGIISAAKTACETIDRCLGQILKRAEELDTTVIITADHGNSEKMCNDDGSPHTAHTTNPVPFIIWRKNQNGLKLRTDEDRGLRDIAPTALELMGLSNKAKFEGRSLIQK